MSVVALTKIVRIPYTRHATNAEARAVSGCAPLNNMVTEWRSRFFGCTSHAVLLVKTITAQLLLWFTSLHQTGTDLQEDPTTRGSEPLNQIWDHWTSILPTRGRRQPLENTGVPLWTWICSRRVCYEERVAPAAPYSRQITKSAPYHSIFYGLEALPDAQTCSSNYAIEALMSAYRQQHT